jgi:hypothetical protein
MYASNFLPQNPLYQRMAGTKNFSIKLNNCNKYVAFYVPGLSVYVDDANLVEILYAEKNNNLDVVNTPADSITRHRISGKTAIPKNLEELKEMYLQIVGNRKDLDKINPNSDIISLINNLELKAIIEGTDCGELNAIYQGYKNWASKFKMNLTKNNLIIEGQFSFSSDNITLGTQGIIDANDGTFIDYNVGICLDQDKNHSYCLYSSNKFKEVALAFYYQINNDAEIGTQVDINIYKNLIEIIAPLLRELFADLQQFQKEGRPPMSISENLDQ